MKKINFFVNCLVVIVAFTFALSMETKLNADLNKKPNSLYDINAKSITGKDRPLSEFKGKVSLVVNTASKCGFTSQYKGLEELYQKYKDQGLVILGFPSNDFAKQEPGTNDEIASFCKVNFGVTFPLFEKARVTGDEKQEVYKFLTDSSNSEFSGDPGWNFVKILVDKNGKVRNRFSSMTGPDSKKIIEEIEKLLKE